ncbi:iron-sulfur cluster assembly 2 homolog, partial [Striga asiatica]
MYNHLAETSSAPQRRKNQKSLVGSAAHRKKTNKLHFHDTDDEVIKRLEECPRLTESLIKKILTVLEQNPYVKFLKRLRDIPDLETYEIVLKTLPNVDQRVFNQPQVSQIAALWVEGEENG